MKSILRILEVQNQPILHIWRLLILILFYKWAVFVCTDLTNFCFSTLCKNVEYKYQEKFCYFHFMWNQNHYLDNSRGSKFQNLMIFNSHITRFATTYQNSNSLNSSRQFFMVNMHSVEITRLLNHSDFTWNQFCVF